MTDKPDASAGTVEVLTALAALKGRLAAISIYDVPESMKPLHKLAADSIACVERILMAIDGRIPMGDLAPLMFPEFHPVEVLTADVVFNAIKHGDEQHQAWLRAKCDELFASGATVCRPAGGDEATPERPLTPPDKARFCRANGADGCADSWHVGGNYGSPVCRHPEHHAAPASPAEPEGRNEFAEHLGVLLEIWEDGKLPYEQRVYVPGAFASAMDDTRAMLMPSPAAEKARD